MVYNFKRQLFFNQQELSAGIYTLIYRILQNATENCLNEGLGGNLHLNSTPGVSSPNIILHKILPTKVY